MSDLSTMDILMVKLFGFSKSIGDSRIKKAKKNLKSGKHFTGCPKITRHFFAQKIPFGPPLEIIFRFSFLLGMPSFWFSNLNLR